VRVISTVNLALPMLLGGFVQFIISQFYQKYATDTLLLDSALVGSIFFISRATDALLDPICGYLSDKTGRRRSFIGLGIFALVLGVVLSFLPALPQIQQGSFAAYACAASGIFTIYLGVTLVYIPHYAWLAEFQKAQPKLPFFASRAVFENFGTILGGAALAALLPLQQSGSSLLLAVSGMTLLLSLAGSVPLFSYRETGRAVFSHDYSLVRSLKMLGVNQRFALVCFMSFANQFAATTLLGASLFYTEYVLQKKELGVTLAVVFLLSATFCVPLWSYLAGRTDRYKLWRFALWAIILVFPTMLLTQSGHLWYLTVFAILVGGMAGAVIVFVPQEVALTTHHVGSDEGLYFAAFTFVNKSAMALPPLVIGVGLKSVGYSAAIRSESSVVMISLLFIALPAAAFVVSAVTLAFYSRLASATSVTIGATPTGTGRP
jgi:GPH family glycoside/pentoside/hexuronide:cation symporter